MNKAYLVDGKIFEFVDMIIEHVDLTIYDDVKEDWEKNIKTQATILDEGELELIISATDCLANCVFTVENKLQYKSLLSKLKAIGGE